LPGSVLIEGFNRRIEFNTTDGGSVFSGFGLERISRSCEEHTPAGLVEIEAGVHQSTEHEGKRVKRDESRSILHDQLGGKLHVVPADPALDLSFFAFARPFCQSGI